MKATTSSYPIAKSVPAGPGRIQKSRIRLDDFLDSLAGPGFHLLRVVTGLLFAFHGMQGLFGYRIPAEFIPKVGSQGWIGALIELTTGLLVASGLFTRWAAFLASGTMAVAYVQFHWKLQFGAQFFPAVNQGESARLFCLVFFHIATRGARRVYTEGIHSR